MVPKSQITTSGSVLARFMEMRGRKIVEGCGALWHGVEGGMLISCPYHEPISPDRDQLMKLLRSVKARGVRFPSMTWAGATSGAYFCELKNYDLPSIHSSFRQKVRKARTVLEIREVESKELLEQGLQLNHDTTRRQGRRDAEFEQPSRWRQLVSAIFRTEGISVLGVFQARQLASYAVLCKEGGVLSILHQMSLASALSLYPNHLLTFEMTKRALTDPEIHSVCYGLESLVQNPGLHNYKLDFGYKFVPLNSVIALHPLLTFLTKPSFRSLVGLVRKSRPKNQRLERLDSVLRTASISRLPVAAQVS
jgi:hypothetical protein